MKFDFKQMEREMNLLEENMNSITAFSEQISNTLQDTRSEISRLSSVHSLLKELQFLFKLPNNLRVQIEEGAYVQVSLNYMLIIVLLGYSLINLLFLLNRHIFHLIKEYLLQ